MWQFLLGSVLLMASHYVLALVYLEGAVYFGARKRSFVALWAVGAIGVFLLLLYWSSDPSYARETRPFAFFIVMLWIVAVPVMVLSAVSLLLNRVRRLAMQQVLIVGTAAVAVFFWPLFALYSVCASGLDCL